MECTFWEIFVACAGGGGTSQEGQADESGQRQNNGNYKLNYQVVVVVFWLSNVTAIVLVCMW